MLKRVTFAALLAVLAGLFATQASAAPPTDFWQNKHFMNMAHAGGADEAPANTLFAFKKAVENGADQLEMDGYVTADGEFVITHDLDPYKSSDAPGQAGGQERIDNQIDNLTLAQLKQFDFAYKFTPGKGHLNYDENDPHPYRGMALEGGPQPPAGFTRNDFRIVTLQEVLDAFPDTPLNVDMKAPYSNQQMATDAAEVVAAIMAQYPERSDDVIIASFFQGAMEKFHELLPSHRALTASEGSLLGYVQGNPINPAPVALQPPDNYNLPPVVDTVPILKQKAVDDGYAIHVWPANGSVDGPELWQKMIDQGADGFFTDRVSELHRFLCEKGIPRPDGSLRCAEQQCPEGFTGYAPNCEEIPKCPDGQTGTPPHCEVIITDPATVLTKVKLSPKKGKIKAGKTFKLKVTVKAKLGLGARKFRINLKSSNKRVKLPKSVVVTLKGNTGKATVKVKATKKAKGKAKITAKHKKLSARSTLTVKKAAKKKRKKARR